MEHQICVLVVDDEPSLVTIAKAYLSREGYEVVTASDGKEALDVWEDTDPNLIILDLMLPVLSGEEVCQRVRRRSSVPIIMLTAKSDIEDRLEGLNLGADDYLTKPFDPRELVARVHAVLRRVKENDEVLFRKYTRNGGKVEFDISGASISIEGVSVPLTAMEFKILSTLAASPNKVFSRLQLGEALLGMDFDRDERAIDAHIKKIRNKISKISPGMDLISTVYGLGYQYKEEPNNA